MRGVFITFEGTEGSGKSTQISRLAARLRALGRSVRALREPGGTPIGEEIRHTLKHSLHNQAMTPEAELLLMCASRAQLVREVIRPALAAREIVLCDRFYDSTIAYQGYGRQLDLAQVRTIIDFAVDDTRPDLTLLLEIPLETSENRRRLRNAEPQHGPQRPQTSEREVIGQPVGPVRDRFEEADRRFFERVEEGFQNIAAAEPQRVRVMNASLSVEAVSEAIWEQVKTLL
jgi:dTMP kinase